MTCYLQIKGAYVCVCECVCVCVKVYVCVCVSVSVTRNTTQVSLHAPLLIKGLLRGWAALTLAVPVYSLMFH